MSHRLAAALAAAALGLFLSSCGDRQTLPSPPGLHLSLGHGNHAQLTATVTFEVPSPDANAANKARVTFTQAGKGTEQQTVGLLAGPSCRPAPVTGLRCAFNVALADEDVTYSIAIFDVHGKLRFTRKETIAPNSSFGYTFVLTNDWTSAYVKFAMPVMGERSQTPLLVTAVDDNYAKDLDGIVVGGQPFSRPIRLIDTDKTGATKLTTNSVTSPAESVKILYNGSSFVNPMIGVANLPNGGQQQFIPVLRAHEFVVPSHNQTSTYAGYGRLLVNSDGSIAFLEPQGVGQIDRNGRIRETKLRLHTYDIAKGPDGNLWILGANTNSVVLARMNGDRSITSYPLPTPTFGQLVLGSDGNFWTAGQSSLSAFTDTVRRISPKGTVTDFPIHGNGVWITGVVAGNDGYVWYVGTAEQQPGGIEYGMFVKVTRDGSHTVLLRSIAGCCAATTVNDPVWGQDGRLYTAVGYQYLGQLRERGSFHVFPTLMQMETAAASPPTIPPMAAGPDGAFWYAATPTISVNGGFCALGRTTTSGQVAFVFFASTCANKSNPDVLPSAIVAGPNRTLWYTRDNRVGKVSL